MTQYHLDSFQAALTVAVNASKDANSDAVGYDAANKVLDDARKTGVNQSGNRVRAGVREHGNGKQALAPTEEQQADQIDQHGNIKAQRELRAAAASRRLGHGGSSGDSPVALGNGNGHADRADRADEVASSSGNRADRADSDVSPTTACIPDPAPTKPTNAPTKPTNAPAGETSAGTKNDTFDNENKVRTKNHLGPVQPASVS